MQIHFENQCLIIRLIRSIYRRAHVSPKVMTCLRRHAELMRTHCTRSILMQVISRDAKRVRYTDVASRRVGFISIISKLILFGNAAIKSSRASTEHRAAVKLFYSYYAVITSRSRKWIMEFYNIIRNAIKFTSDTTCRLVARMQQ